MAEQSDTVYFGCYKHARCNIRIGVQLIVQTIPLHAHTVVCSETSDTRFRPDCVRVGTVAFSVSCIYYVYKVYNAVGVDVIFRCGEVCLFRSQSAGFLYHFTTVDVFCRTAVLSIICHIL